MVARRQRQVVGDGDRADQRVADPATRDAEVGEPAQQRLGVACAQEPRRWKARLEQAADDRRRSPRRRRQPREHGESLEGRMTRETDAAAPDRAGRGHVMRVIRDDERDCDARVDERVTLA